MLLGFNHVEALLDNILEGRVSPDALVEYAQSVKLDRLNAAGLERVFAVKKDDMRDARALLPA